MVQAAAAVDPAADQRRLLLATRHRLAEIFTPTRPLADRRASTLGYQSKPSFIGREAERERITRALIEDRSHVIIFGERGRGKTSLANLVVAQAQTAEFVVARYVCSAASDFDAIMRGLFQDLPHWLATQGPHAASLLPTHPLRPGDISSACGALHTVKVIMLIDEFDRVTDQDTRTALADTIKQLSDRGIPALFMIIGVSDSPEALLGRHPSIQRCVTRVALPLLTPAQVEDLVERGAAQAGLDFPASARTCIAELARGVPYMAQLLALRAGQAALDHGRATIHGSDLISAIEAAAIEADPRTLILYDEITHSERDLAALAVLRAAAGGAQDELGRIRAVSLGRTVRVAGLQVDATAWQRVLASGAIQPVRGDGPDLFAFTEAMLPQLVLLRAVLSRQATRRPVPPGPDLT